MVGSTISHSPCATWLRAVPDGAGFDSGVPCWSQHFHACLNASQIDQAVGRFSGPRLIRRWRKGAGAAPVDTSDWITLLAALPGGIAGVVLVIGRKRVAGWCVTLWRAMVRAWLSRWVPFVVRVRTTILVHHHERVFRKGQRSEYIRRYDAAQDFFESGAKALRRYVLDHGSVLKTTRWERSTCGLGNRRTIRRLVEIPTHWGDPFITTDDSFLDHVAKIRSYDIVDSWHLAALHWWWRCRQKVAVKWKAARLRRRILRDEHEARRIRVIHWFAWPIALPALTWIVWQLIEKGVAP